MGCMVNDIDKVVAACQRKEKWGQKALYDEFSPMLLGVCMRYTHSRDEAQDLLQEGFIKVFAKIGTVREPQKVGAWMYAIMVRESINYVSRRLKVHYCDAQQLDDSEQSTFAQPFDTDEFEVAEVVRALQKVPDLYRMAFNLRVVEELDYADISEQLGIPESTARSAVARARLLVVNILKKRKVIL